MKWRFLIARPVIPAFAGIHCLNIACYSETCRPGPYRDTDADLTAMQVFDQVVLLLLIVVPLAGALLTMMMPGNRPRDVWYFAVLVSALSFLLSVALFMRYDYEAGGFQFQKTYDWLEVPVHISLSLGVDGITAPLILLNGIILLGGVLISQNIQYRTRDFFVLLLALGAGVYGTFVVRDLFFLFFFYELAVCPCTCS